MNSAERWRQLRELFDAAVDVAPDARAATIAALTSDEGLVREVLALLVTHDREDGRLESGPGAFIFANDSDADQSRVGQHIGPYRLTKEIGRGGMGAVYEAVRDDAEYEKRVAVKVIKSGMNSDTMVRRFRRERQFLAALDHPNIARLLDGAVTPDGRPYLVMEFVDGQPIDAYCDARQLGIRERVALFVSVCNAVDFAHRNLIVHRDLKPGNILVTADGTPKLLDFGIAKLVTPDDDGSASTMTAVGMRFFTPEYASPEQLRDEPDTTRGDVYSLGVILYELLSGRQPFRAEGRSANNIERILTTEPAPPSSLQRKLSGDLDNIVMMALRKEPARRYISVEQFAEDLRRYLDGRPVIATRDSAGYRFNKFVTRHRVGVAAAAIVLLSLAGGVSATVWQAHLARQEAARADAERAQAEQVMKFLIGIFGSADPSWGNTAAKVGPNTTVMEAMQNSVRNIGTELAGQPDAEATVRRTIGNVYLSAGLPDSGLSQLRAAVALRRRFGAEPARNLALDLEGLGVAQYFKGDLPSASASLHEALRIFARIGDSTSMDFANTQTNLATALMPMGQLAEAETLVLSSVKLWRHNVGDAHPAMGTAYDNLASLRSAHGDLAGGERYLRQALAVYAQLHDREYFERGTVLLNLAYVLKWRGKYAEADSLLHEALGVYERTGTTRPYAGYAYLQLAHLHYLAGQPAQAETEVRRARTILTESGEPPTHADQLRVNTVESLILRELGRLPEAEVMVRRSLPGGVAPAPPHDQRTAEAIGALGRILASRGRRAEAGPLLAQSHADFARLLGEKDPRTKLAARADSLFRAGLAVGK